MPALFASLPGIEVPVGGIGRGFAKLWAGTQAQDFKAMQLNLVLHLGRNTTPADALAQFEVAKKFAQRSPCRVVVLCPDFAPEAPAELRAKIYGECFLGKSKSDTRCVEFVLLHYTMAVRQHLENQVSLCLSTDLPLYYWAHRFSAASRLIEYKYLLTRSKRILFDSAHAPADAFAFPWPNIAAVRDLAYTRTLPLRQNLGQFLSRYEPAAIVGGLRRVTLRHHADLAAEGTGIMTWLKKGLARAGAEAGQGLEGVVTPGGCPASFSLAFSYDDPATCFRWSADLARNHAEFEGDLGAGRTTLAVGARLLAPEMALSEAIFF